MLEDKIKVIKAQLKNEHIFNCLKKAFKILAAPRAENKQESKYISVYYITE
jgi:hypothetical protein